MLDNGFGIPLLSEQRYASRNQHPPKRCIWIARDELNPGKLGDILECMEIEGTPLKYWLLLAFSYKSLGHLDSFVSILNIAENKFRSKQKSSRSEGPLYSALAYHNLKQSHLYKNDRERRSKFADFARYYMRKTQQTSSYHYYMLQGHEYLRNFSLDKNPEHLSTAKTMFHRALSYNPVAMTPYIQFGNLMVINSNYHMAMVFYLRCLVMTTYYTSIIENIRNPGILETGYLYELALVKTQLISLKAILLFAMAACQLALGNTGCARVIIEESLTLKPLSVAYRLLAVINVRELTQFKNKLERSDVEIFMRDYTTSCLASNILECKNLNGRIQLCNILFHRRFYDRCRTKLMDLQKTNLPYNLKAELEYQLGRLHHVHGRYTEAMNHYLSSLAIRNDFMSARLQLVKVAVGCGDLAVARENVDFLLQCLHKVPVVLKLAAYVYLCSARETLESNRWEMLKLESAHKNQNQLDISCMFHTLQQGMGRLVDERLFKAVSLLEEFLFSCTYTTDLRQNSSDFSAARLEYRGVPRLEKETTDPVALEYYIRALEMLVSRGREYLCPKLKNYYCEYFKMFTNKCPQFLNNFGVILMYSRNYFSACQVLKNLTRQLPNIDKPRNGRSRSSRLNHMQHGSRNPKRAKVSYSEFQRKTVALTVRFNYALSLEFSGQESKANKIYSEITVEYPTYIAAWLRKSIIAFKKNDYDSSVRYLDQVKKVNRLSFEPYLLRAYQLGKLKSFAEAIQELKKMFKTIPASTYDPYSNTLLASLMIRKAYKEMGDSGRNTNFSKETMHHAKMALKRPSVCNFYAANCIAVILANNGKLKMAYESFLLLLESLSVTSHMKLLVNKNIGILSTALTLGMLRSEKKIDKNKLNKVKVAKTQQFFESAISNGKMDKHLYHCYIRFLFDVQMYEECIAMSEVARMIFEDDKFLYNEVMVADVMVCTYLRDVDRANSVHGMTNMLCSSKFIISNAEYLLEMKLRDPEFMSPECVNKVKQILTRMNSKVMPHIEASLPQLEKGSEHRQRAREKRLQLQISIQQAQEAKRRQLEEERIRTRKAEEALSQQLLKEASEIASELLTSKPSQTT